MTLQNLRQAVRKILSTSAQVMVDLAADEHPELTRDSKTATPSFARGPR